MDPFDGFVPLSEAALALRMNRERVLRRVQAGELPGAQIAGRWFLRRDALPPAPKAA